MRAVPDLQTEDGIQARKEQRGERGNKESIYAVKLSRKS